MEFDRPNIYSMREICFQIFLTDNATKAPSQGQGQKVMGTKCSTYYDDSVYETRKAYHRPLVDLCKGALNFQVDNFC